MDQYIALSKKDVKIHITLNEIYSTQALLVKHLEQLVRPSTVPTNLDLRGGYPPRDITKRPRNAAEPTPAKGEYDH